MSKSKKQILTEDTFNANGKSVVTSEILNEEISVNDTTLEESEEPINEEEISDDKNNDEIIDDVKKEDNDVSDVVESVVEDTTEIIEDAIPEEPVNEEEVVPVVKPVLSVSKSIEEATIETCHDDLYYTGKLI